MPKKQTNHQHYYQLTFSFLKHQLHLHSLAQLAIKIQSSHNLGINTLKNQHLKQTILSKYNHLFKQYSQFITNIIPNKYNFFAKNGKLQCTNYQQAIIIKGLLLNNYIKQHTKDVGKQCSDQQLKIIFNILSQQLDYITFYSLAQYMANFQAYPQQDVLIAFMQGIDRKGLGVIFMDDFLFYFR